jgi:di/tripeptidase
MITGKDVAKFMTQATGEDYSALYDASKEYNEGQITEAKNEFMDMVQRMKKVDENLRREVL